MSTKKEKRSTAFKPDLSGAKIPRGNPTLVAKVDVNADKLSKVVKDVFAKIAAKKDGVRLHTLREIESLGKPGPVQWKVRALLSLGYVKAVAEAKKGA